MFILGAVKITRQVLVYSNFFFIFVASRPFRFAVDDRKEGERVIWVFWKGLKYLKVIGCFVM